MNMPVAQVTDQLAGFDPAYSWTQMQAEDMKRDLKKFVAEAWHVVEPGKEFKGGWHIDAICEHLTYVSLGDIDDLVINIPPRHSKSTIVAVMWPAWEWIWNPSVQWLFATYASSLTLRDSVKCRRLIQSPWYQERFGNSYQLSSDLNQKGRFDNTFYGYRLATSVGGTATGEGGDRIVVDDAHNMKEINSDTIRAGVIDWWRDTMSTRGNDMKKLGRVIIAQRGHHQDLPGHVLATGGWVHLNLPGYFVPNTRCITKSKKESKRIIPMNDDGIFTFGDHIEPLKKGEVIFVDPRQKENDLLQEDRFGPDEMAKLSMELTERGFESQIQQNPSAKGGNIMKEHHWREWVEPELPEIQMIIQSYDTAFEEEEESDFSARTTWGVFEYEERLNPKLPWTAQYKGQKRLCLILLERLNKRMEFPELRENAIEAAQLWKPDKVLVEKKASGHSLAQELRRANLPIARIKVNDSKFVRAHAASLVLERGCIFYVKRNWAQEVITQCGNFPADDHDDMVDSCTMAMLWLRKKWSADFLDDDDDNDDLMRYVNKPVRTYGGVRGAR
jgi:predicted phage terminase large subunit-like protein